VAGLVADVDFGVSEDERTRAYPLAGETHGGGDDHRICCWSTYSGSGWAIAFQSRNGTDSNRRASSIARK
jgi:hypothetical protein